MQRPEGSNADEWVLFIQENIDTAEFLAVQIAEAIDEAVKRGVKARGDSFQPKTA